MSEWAVSLWQRLLEQAEAKLRLTEEFLRQERELNQQLTSQLQDALNEIDHLSSLVPK